MVKFIAIVLCSFALSWYIFSVSLDARWYIIDDHEIMNFLGPDKHISLLDTPLLIEKTEIVNLEIHPRYRPAHWLIVILQSWLWGDNPFAWYLFKMMAFTLFVSVFWWISSYYAGIVYGGIFTLYVLSQTYWVDIWTKLGAPEVNAAWGLALYAAGFFAVLKNGANDDIDVKLPGILYWMLMTAGALIAMGSKENFLIILLPQTCLLLYLLVRGKLDSNARFFGSLIIGFGLLMAAVIAYLIKRHGGSDFYSKSAGLSERIGTFLTYMDSLLARLHQWGVGNTVLIVVASVIAVLVFIAGGIIFRQKGTAVAGGYFSAISKTTALLILLALIVASQIIFYNGYWPVDNRFDFPGKLAFPVACLAIILAIMKVLASLDFKPKTINTLKFILAVVFLVIVIHRGFVPLREATAKHVAVTREFTDKIQRLSTMLNEHPQTPLVFESHNVWDYEPIFSVERFLSVNKVKNPLFLRIHKSSGAAPNTNALLPEFELKLARQLHDISVRGSLPMRETGQFTRFIRNQFLPLSVLNDSQPCFSIGFSGDSSGTCKYLMRIF
ncbi:MAG: hypothetical protein HQL05_09670 [Nitrospirae bacterium]|uniref:hypothetical protein n=1 Tax=Candidatus Magnetobacterium casense TaxID=1455061 RepID=UPI00058D02F2|nr:hypothetical protein [Candidatus Magnetobacterium casensis]MBF0338087.1 hypothetical protein [Nitrospirota bacterium]